MSLHFNIATEGLLGNPLSIATLGLLGIVEVIIQPSTYGPGGGGGGGIVIEQLYDITIIVKWNGKRYIKTYCHVPINWAVNIIATFRKLSIKVMFTGISEKVKGFVSSINYSKVKPPVLKAEVKEDISISVKRKKK